MLRRDQSTREQETFAQQQQQRELLADTEAIGQELKQRVAQLEIELESQKLAVQR